MAILTVYPSANTAASGFNGSWTNPNNAHADDAVYATVTNMGRNKEFATYWHGFDFSAIPAGSTINSVTVEVQWKASATNSVAEFRSSAFSDHSAGTATTAIGSSPGVSDTAEPTTDTTRSYTIPASLAQLQASGFAVRVQALQGATNTGYTGSLDFVRVVVNYTAPVTVSGSFTADAFIKKAGIGGSFTANAYIKNTIVKEGASSSVTKTWPYTSTAESFTWVPTSGGNTALSWLSGAGNPAGSISIGGTVLSTDTEAGRIRWAGTWADMGATAPVQQVRLANLDSFLRTLGANIGTPTFGAIEIRTVVGGTLIATLHAGRGSVFVVDSAWHSLSGTAQDVPSAYQATSTGIEVRIHFSVVGDTFTDEPYQVDFDNLSIEMLSPGGITMDAEISAPPGVPVEGSFTADAYISKTTSGSLTADAYIKRLDLAGSFTADAYVKRADQQGSFTADAFVARTASDNFTADAYIKRTDLSGSLTADAFIKATLSGSLTADAFVKRTDLAGSFTADANISRGGTGSVTLDAHISRTGLSGTFSADAYIRRTFEGSFTADAYVSKVQSGSVSADAFIQRTFADALTADAYILRTQSGSLTMDAEISAPEAGVVTGSFTANAFIKATVGGSLTADAYIQREQSGSFVADAYVRRTFEQGITADAFIFRTQAGSFAADAFILHTYSSGFTADAMVSAVQGGSFTLDAEIAPPEPGERLGSFSADAYIKRVDLSGSFTADAYIGRTTAGSFTADAFLQREQAAAFTADAFIARTATGSFTVDAFIARVGTGSFTVDAFVAATVAGAFTLDAHIYNPSATTRVRGATSVAAFGGRSALSSFRYSPTRGLASHTTVKSGISGTTTVTGED